MPLRLRELETLLRLRDTENLRSFLAEHASTFWGELGVEGDEIERLLALDDGGLSARLDRLVRRRREHRSAHRDAGLRAEAARGAVQLVETARFRDQGVELDAGLLLGPVLAGHALYLFFHVDGVGIAVERARLLQARRALRPFPDVTAHVGSDALRLGWRGGRGGLVLRPQIIAPSDRDRVLHVVLDRPILVVAALVRELPPMPPPDSRSIRPLPPRPRPGAWLADVLAAVGSHL